MRVTEDIIPAAEFEAEPSTWLEHAQRTGHPVIVTREGRAAGILLSPAAFDELTEGARFVQAVVRGLEDADAGRVHTHEAVLQEMKQRQRARTKKKG